MSKLSALQDALKLAKKSLLSINIYERGKNLGLFTDKSLTLRSFGKNYILDLSTLTFKEVDSSVFMKDNDTLLLLHYLLYDFNFEPTNDLISFREISGGEFYFQPFLSRSVNPLLGRIKNNLQVLQTNLDRFDWEKTKYGDLGAKIHAFAKVYLILIYHLGDDEFPAGCEVLFDSSIKKIFKAEDVTVLASRICIGLL